MKKKLLMIPILMGLIVGGDFVAHADSSDSGSYSAPTAQKAPDKRAGQPESAVTSYSEPSQPSHQASAVIESSKSSGSNDSNNDNGGSGSSTGSQSSTGNQSTGGSTSSGSTGYYGGGSAATANYGGGSTSGGSGDSDYHGGSETAGIKETASDRKSDRSHGMTDSERRNATKKAKIAIAKATVNLQNANHEYKNLKNSENRHKLVSAQKELKRANDHLTKIEL